MARSIKKGPYVFDRLLTKVQKLNETGKKEVIKTWSVLLVDMALTRKINNKEAI